MRHQVWKGIPMRLVRNLTTWLFVGVFTVVLGVGVEIVSHKTFSHAAPSRSALSVTTSGASTNAATSSSTAVANATLQSTPGITITRTYHGDDASSSFAATDNSSAITQASYQDN